LSVGGVGVDSGTDAEKNVTLDQCAMVSKRLDQNPGFELLLPDGCVVEVSSPGINRKLRRPEHYRGAIGERVKVKFGREQDGSRAYPEVDSEASAAKVGQPGSVGVVRGKLSAFDGNILEIDDEERHELVRLGLGQVREARVDFLFDKV
jgi:ribosome maturation factor RimP